MSGLSAILTCMWDTSRTNAGIGKLRSALGRCERNDALAKIAGLQLLPANSEHVSRLEAAAYAVAGGGEDCHTRISPSRLRRVLNQHDSLLRLASHEDPLPGPFCRPVLFIGHDHLVLPGYDPNAVFTLDLLARTLFLHPDRTSVKGIERARRRIATGLSLSHRVCSKAGLTRSTRFEEGAGGEIAVPPSAALATLSAAATLTDGELEYLEWRRKVDGDGLDSLTVAPSDLSIADYVPDNHLLARRPVVRIEGGLVVACPTALAGATVASVVAALEEDGGLADLLRLLRDTVRMQTQRVAKDIGLKVVDLVETAHEDIDIWLTASDMDKAILLVVITDGRQNRQVEWDLQERICLAAETAGSAAANLRETNSQLHDVSALFVIQNLGDEAVAGLAEPVSGLDRCEGVSLEELSVLADVLGDKPNRLHYFLEDLDVLRKRTEQVMAFSLLDIFDQWQCGGDSFYAGDDNEPVSGAVFLGPQGSGTVRREAATSMDRHAARMPSSNRGIGEVERYYKRFDVPVYFPTHSEHLALLVEGLTVPVWVTASKFPEDLPVPVEPQLVEAMAYWVWRLTPILNPVLEYARLDELRIDIILEDFASWLHLMDKREVSAEGSVVEAVAGETDDQNGLLELRVQPAFAAASDERDDLELDLVEALVRAIVVFLPDHRHGDLQPILQFIAMERQNPLRRMLHTFSENPELNPVGAPRRHSLERAQNHRILDALGAELISRELLPHPLEDEKDIGKLLEGVVSLLFEQLEKYIARFGGPFLEYLVVECEAQLLWSRVEEVRFRYVHAAFSGVADIIGAGLEDIPQQTSAGMAARFLVEYVAAKPPVGDASPSRTDLEHLLALAAAVIDYAMERELCTVGVGPTQACVLPSGRLGLTRRDAVLDAREEYLRGLLETRVNAEDEGAEGQLPTVWTPELERGLEEAFRDEFGLPILDFIAFFQLLMDMGFDEGRPWCRLPEARLVELLHDKLGLPSDVAMGMLDAFSLAPRSDFSTPPPGFAHHDLWPWRFGRRYSYIARPLVRVRRDDEEVGDVVWGPRHAFVSGTHLLLLIASGRYRGRSQRMKSLEGRLHNVHGERFNDEVASRLEALDEFRVIRRFTHVGDVAMPAELGDIDVLALDVHQRRMWAVECKDFASARTPTELRNDLNDLCQVAVDKHARRLAWVEQNVCNIVRGVLGSGDNKWRSFGLIVSSEPQLSSRLKETKIPIVSVDELRTTVGAL